MRGNNLLICDWNGTLVDDVAIAHKCIEHMFLTVAPGTPAPSFETYRQEYTNADFCEFFYRHGIPRSVDVKRILETWWSSYKKMSQENLFILNTGVISLLSSCQRSRMPVAIVSSASIGIGAYLEELHVADFFRSVKTRTGVAWTKTGAIRETCAELGFVPRAAFYVDDTFDGIAEAQGAGVRTIGFTGGVNSEEKIRAARPNHIVASIADVARIIGV